jgi:hypothetical protein
MLLKNCIIFGITAILLLTSRWGYNEAFADEMRSVWTKNLPHESWMNVTLMGVKIGRFHIYADRAEYKGESVIRINSDLFAEIKRFGLSMKSTKTKLCYLRDDLSPCYFMSRSNETGQEKIVEGTVENGVATIKTTLGDQTIERQQKLPDDVIFAETLEEMAIRRGLKVGDEYTLDTFSLDFFDTIEVKVSVINSENIEYKGETKKVFVVEYTMNVMGGVVTRQWMTADGEVYSMEMPSMGMSFAKVDKKEAMGSVGQLDIISGTRIELEGEQPKAGIREFKVKVTLSNGNIRETFVNGDRQKVYSSEDDLSRGIIEVKLNDINGEKSQQLPINEPEFLPFLSPSVYIQSDDPDIISKAQDIVKDEKNTWKAAIKLCNWVNSNIKDKNYKVGFGTAKQTLEDLQGDCSEHTVLFIGLARAAGIPSRICTGIVYHKDAFYYHFWPEVYIGRWVEMEPTLGQMQADATHIKFITSPVETESALELGEGVLRTMNRLKLERIEN